MSFVVEGNLKWLSLQCLRALTMSALELPFMDILVDKGGRSLGFFKPNAKPGLHLIALPTEMSFRLSPESGRNLVLKSFPVAPIRG